MSRGKFTEELATADMTACAKRAWGANAPGGCKGGSPVRAAEWLRTDGVVTGGDFSDRNSGTTCYPYPIADANSEQHFHSQVPPPECVEACPESGYKRDYAKDKYFASG